LFGINNGCIFTKALSDIDAWSNQRQIVAIVQWEGNFIVITDRRVELMHNLPNLRNGKLNEVYLLAELNYLFAARRKHSIALKALLISKNCVKPFDKRLTSFDG